MDDMIRLGDYITNKVSNLNLTPSPMDIWPDGRHVTVKCEKFDSPSLYIIGVKIPRGINLEHIHLMSFMPNILIVSEDFDREMSLSGYMQGKEHWDVAYLISFEWRFS